MLFDLINRADVGMVEGRGSACFGLKAFQCTRITRHFFRQKLQGNTTTQFQVLRLVYHSHSPATEDFQNSVVGNFLANQVLGPTPSPAE